jgi:[ribosomal protein S5]-alanine N-acetyltransferase
MSEVYINSERLLLLIPRIEILKKRLKQKRFYEKISIEDFTENIFFPADWPGDALEIYPFEIERRERNLDILPFWTYNIIDKTEKIVVGDICCKSKPNKENEIEIGYGINSSQQKKGYATEAVLSFISYFFSNTNVVSIKAECNSENLSSIRVLEKCCFKKVGNRFDDEDGNLIVWKKSKKTYNKSVLLISSCSAAKI